MQKQIQGRLRECIKQKKEQETAWEYKDTRLYTAVKQEHKEACGEDQGGIA